MEREEIVMFDLRPALSLVERFEVLLMFYPDGVRGLVMDHFKHFCTYFVNSPMQDGLGQPVEGAYEWDEVVEAKVIARYEQSPEWRLNQLAVPAVNHEDTLSWITTTLVALFHEHYADEIDVIGSEVLNHGKMEWYDTFIGIPLHPKQSWNRPSPKFL